MKSIKSALFLTFGFLVLAFFLLCAFTPKLLTPFSVKEMFAPWMPPGGQHVLGTNDLGYDIFTELIYAAPATLLIGLSAAFVSLTLGTAAGLFAGFTEGFIAEAGNGVIQMFLMIPFLPMAIVIAAYFGNSTISVITIIAILGWSGTARTVRVRTMQLKQSPFVESLAILGISKARIVYAHIVPNLGSLVFSRYIMTAAQAVMLEASLSFLGIGDPLRVTWGRMINIAYRRGAFIRGAYNWLLPPGICIALVIVAFYCVNQFFEMQSDKVSGAASYLD
jgi:peptide/nickel transport system permease protein